MPMPSKKIGRQRIPLQCPRIFGPVVGNKSGDTDKIRQEGDPSNSILPAKLFAGVEA